MKRYDFKTLGYYIFKFDSGKELKVTIEENKDLEGYFGW